MNKITIFNSVILLLQFYGAYLLIVIAEIDATNYVIKYFRPLDSNKIKIIKETNKYCWANTIIGIILVLIFLEFDKFGFAGGLKIVDNKASYDNLLFNPPFFIALISTYFISKIRIVKKHTDKYKKTNKEDWYNYHKKLIEKI